MFFILDTNVISEMMLPVPDAAVVAWFRQHSNDDFATTTISYAEIYAGIELLAQGKRKQALRLAAQNLFDNEFAGRIYSFDPAAGLEMALVNAERTRLGLPISFPDACIAAICLVHKATVATRDVGGFVKTGIQIVNPWA